MREKFILGDKGAGSQGNSQFGFDWQAPTPSTAKKKKKKNVQSTSSVTFLEVTSRIALAALSSWTVNVVSLSYVEGTCDYDKQLTSQ